jgi:hypothetical protein
MNMEQLKQYILSILVDNADKLAISPDLLIDRLFDKLSVIVVKDIDEWHGSGHSEAKQIIWDRYLMHILAQTDQHVKVFAR